MEEKLRLFFVSQILSFLIYLKLFTVLLVDDCLSVEIVYSVQSAMARSSDTVDLERVMSLSSIDKTANFKKKLTIMCC